MKVDEEYKINDMIVDYMIAKLKYGYVPSYNLEEFMFMKEYMGSILKVEYCPLSIAKIFSNLKSEMDKKYLAPLKVNDNYEVLPTYYLNNTLIDEDRDKLYQEYLKKYMSRRELEVGLIEESKRQLAERIAQILILRNNVSDLEVYNTLVERITNLIMGDNEFRISNNQDNLLAYNNFLLVVDKYQYLFEQILFQVNSKYYIEISGKEKNVYQYFNVNSQDNLKLVRKK